MLSEGELNECHQWHPESQIYLRINIYLLRDGSQMSIKLFFFGAAL